MKENYSLHIHFNGDPSKELKKLIDKICNKAMSKHDILREEIKNDSMCPVCNVKMRVTKKEPRKHFEKCKTMYFCDICGVHHRKRTLNEILRDLDMR